MGLLHTASDDGPQASPALSLPAAWEAYPPGWIDRLTAYMERLGARSILVYGAAALALNGLGWLVRLGDSVYPTGPVLLFQIMATSSPVIYIALIHYLDRVARRALRRLSPTLNINEEQFSVLLYRLTTLPRSITWLVTGVGALLGVATMGATAAGFIFRGAFVITSPATAIFGVLLAVLINVAALVFFAHVVWQLIALHYIHTYCLRVDLYNREPLYAFSILTASTAISWILLAYLWVATYPDPTADVVNMGYAVLFAVLSLVTFVWPLWGIHRRLEETKSAATAEVTQLIHQGNRELHQLVERGAYQEVGPVGQALSNLRYELEMLEKIPTWPWRPETARTVYTAIFLPILLWIITRVLEQVIRLG